MPIVTMPNGDRVQFPDDMPPDQIKGMIAKKFPDAGKTDTLNDELFGAAKGFTKGVASLATQVPGIGTPSVNELDPRVEQWENAPAGNVGETVGKFAGQAAPFVIGGPEAIAGRGIAEAIPFAGKFAGPIGEFLGNTLVGAGAGAAQPPGEGGSRLTNAVAGGTTAGLLTPGVAGGLSAIAGRYAAGLGLAKLAALIGWEPALAVLTAGPWGPWSLARRVGKTTGYGGKVAANVIPAGLAGTAGGQAAETLEGQ